MKVITKDYQAGEGELYVCHIPQIPGESFEVLVDSLIEGRQVMDVLASYDLFQLENNIKPNYSSAQDLNVFENGEWITWYDDDGNDIDELEIVNGELVSIW